MNVLRSEAGMATNTIRASRSECRNSSITRATSTTAITKSWVTASADSRVNSDESSAIISCTPCLAYFC